MGARKLSLVERLLRIQRSAFGAGGLGPIEVARRWPPYARSALLTLVIALITALVVAQNFLPNRLNLRPGDVATQDVQAPRTVRYESVSKTQEARDTAAKQVPDQFDGSITSQQRQALDSLNGRITELRQSSSSDPDRTARLSLLEPQLSDSQRSYLLHTDEATLAAIFKNSGDLVQELMSNGIKAGTLRSAQATATPAPRSHRELDRRHTGPRLPARQLPAPGDDRQAAAG